MRRMFRFVILASLIVGFGSTAVFGQSTVPADVSSIDRVETVSSKHLDATNEKMTLSSRGDVDRALMYSANQKPPVSTVSLDNTAEVDLSSSPMKAMQQSDGGGGGRRVLYIVGGALVVGGAIAGILALSGDDGRAGIPLPPNRP